jgi:hypothetical protein
LADYDEYDNMDDSVTALDLEDTQIAPSSHDLTLASQNSEMENPNSEDLPILLPSSLGWGWCVSHGIQSLAAKEAQLRLSQAHDAIHRIRLALGFKSALFRTQVRPANTQQTKTRAWNAISSVETTLHEHARIYGMARDKYRSIREAHSNGPDLPQLRPEDLHVATMVLGSKQVGQRNKQQSWIWGFGKAIEDDGTWMDDCKLLILQSLVMFDVLTQLNS